MLFLITFILAALVSIAYYYRKRKLFLLGAQLPGPKPWPIIGNGWDFLSSNINIAAILRKYHKKHGLVAIWFCHKLHVFIYSPELVKAHCQSTKLLERGEKIKILEDLMPKGLIVANGSDWKKAKKLMEVALPYSNFKHYIQTFQKEGNILIKNLECEVGKPCFPIIRYIKKTVFDTIAAITVDSKERAQTSGISWLKCTDMYIDLVNKRAFNVLYQLKFMYKLFPQSKKYYRIVNLNMEKANKEIQERKEAYALEKKQLIDEENFSKGKRKMFWQTLLDDESLSFNEVRDHVLNLLISGFETTTNALSFAIVMLALHQDVQEKAYQEVNSVIIDDFDEEKIRELEYVEMVVKETLRLFPTVPLTYRKATEDILLGHYLIPAGADVSIYLPELHRDPEQYDDPLKFNPDHFLPENIAKRHPYSYMPFVSGIRKCIGYKFAIYELKVLVSTMLLHYKFECDYKSIGDMKVRTKLSLTMPDGFLVRISKR